MKVYAKNPVGELVLDNPNKKTNGKMNKKTTTKNKGKSRSNSRKNPAKGIVATGKKMYIKYAMAAVGSIGIVRILQYGLQKAGSHIPAHIKEALEIGLPGATGVALAYKSKNEIVQGLAGGMVFASANGLINKLLPATVTGVADAYDNHYLAGPSDIVVKPNGIAYQNGKPVAQVGSGSDHGVNYLGAPPHMLAASSDTDVSHGWDGDENNDQDWI